ncbi:MAG: hypothetical protein RBT65_08165 [Methanolobus sp.]|nr:hypothetical protein [Methanolobus sp.]
MKSKIKIEEIVGVLIGGAFFYAWAFAILIAGLGNIRYVSDWAMAGMLPFFLIMGHYLIAGNVIENNKKIDDKTGIKSILVGFFVWLLLSILFSITKTEISYYEILGGGYFLMLVIYFYLKSKITESDKYKHFTITHAALFIGVLWALYNLLTGK